MIIALDQIFKFNGFELDRTIDPNTAKPNLLLTGVADVIPGYGVQEFAELLQVRYFGIIKTIRF